jgi:hypothetical protein
MEHAPDAWRGEQVTAIEMIAAERERQIEQEGWTAEHDAKEHNNGDLTKAGISYAAQAATQLKLNTNETCDTMNWPWDYKWWKPSPDPVRNLVKAGALIAAEIDRLKRVGPDRGGER